MWSHTDISYEGIEDPQVPFLLPTGMCLKVCDQQLASQTKHKTLEKILGWVLNLPLTRSMSVGTTLSSELCLASVYRVTGPLMAVTGYHTDETTHKIYFYLFLFVLEPKEGQATLDDASGHVHVL